ncbi:MAG: adenosine kinase [Alphaproteobacteria bacterium]
MTEETFYDVVGIGNAIVDVLARVGDGFLTERELPKDDMILLGALEAGKIYNDIIPEIQVSGGSSANTVAGIASLGGNTAYIGKIHEDELGQSFKRSIGSAGVDFFTEPLNQGPSTGRSIILVTPDAKRSMFTYLGASAELSKDDIDEDIIKRSKYLYVEGYLWDDHSSKMALLKAFKLAKRNNRKVAFSLSGKTLAENNRLDFLKIINRYVDVLFGNEEEFVALLDMDFYEGLDFIKDKVEIAAITRGEKGSVVVKGRTKTFVEAEKVEAVVDTTGAGDLYAAGFLFGLNQGRSLGTCAIIGSICAAEVISHYGARSEVALRGFVRNKLLEYGINAEI